VSELLQDIIDKLILQGLATAKDIDIFKDFEPDTPSTCICVNEYTGTAPIWHTGMSNRSIQITTRDLNSNVARQKCWEIYKAWASEELISSLLPTPSIIAMVNTPVKIKRDSLERTTYGFNMKVTVKLDEEVI